MRRVSLLTLLACAACTTEVTVQQDGGVPPAGADATARFDAAFLADAGELDSGLSTQDASATEPDGSTSAPGQDASEAVQDAGPSFPAIQIFLTPGNPAQVTIVSIGADHFHIAVATDGNGANILYTGNGSSIGSDIAASNNTATFTPPSSHPWVSAEPVKGGAQGNWSGFIQTTPSSADAGSTDSGTPDSGSAGLDAATQYDAGSSGSIAVGINDAVGMGKGWSDFIISNGGGARGSGLIWARRGITGPYKAGSQNVNVDDGSVDYALAAGFNVAIILGDSECNMTLSDAQSWMTGYAKFGNRIVWEYGNEPWNGNGSALVPPGQFAQVFKSIYDWKTSAATLASYPGLASQPLTIPVIGIHEGIPAGQNGEWWLQRYLDAVPNLQVDGFTSHPYGPANQQYSSSSSWVLEAVSAERDDAITRGFSPDLPWYITEWGFSLRQGYGPYASSYADQDSKTLAGLNEIASWPWVKGIWIYTSHDDSTGYFGVFTTYCSTGAYDSDGAGEHVGGCEDNANGAVPINNRPVFKTLVDFASAHR